MRKRVLRDVCVSEIREVRGGLLGPNTSRRLRIWQLDLSRGHQVERRVTYPKSTSRRANGWDPRSLSEAKPAPTRALCDFRHHPRAVAAPEVGN